LSVAFHFSELASAERRNGKETDEEKEKIVYYFLNLENERRKLKIN
jgi:hypothetical protein